MGKWKILDKTDAVKAVEVALSQSEHDWSCRARGFNQPAPLGSGQTSHRSRGTRTIW